MENRFPVRGLTCEASSETENRLLVRGLTCEASSETENRYPVRGLSCEASSEAENRLPRTRWGLASSCLLASIFTGSKRFFRFLLRGPLFTVPDTIDLSLISLWV